MTASDRVRAHTERTSDALLDLETAALARLDETVQRVADAARQRIETAAKVSRLAVLRAELLPDPSWVAGLALPIVADLLASAREQAVGLLVRQVAVIASTYDSPDLADAAEQAARQAAADVERSELAGFGDNLHRTLTLVEDRAGEQRRLWWAQHEEAPALIARVCSRERVGLPGAQRGAAWYLEAPQRASARAACVSATNRIVTAGMEGWNRARG